MRNPNSCIPDINKIFSPSGTRKKILYESHFDGKKIILRENGSRDLQQEIEAFAPFTDLAYMLHRLSIGDRSVLSSNQPIYGDFSGWPNNPIDAINLVHNAELSFDQLAPEVREQFNNDHRVWLASLFSSGAGVQDQRKDNSKRSEPIVKASNTTVKESEDK